MIPIVLGADALDSLEIERRYLGVVLSGRIEAADRIVGGVSAFDSLSTAGGMARTAVPGSPTREPHPQTNGWTFWEYLTPDGTRRRLDTLRRELHERKNRQSRRASNRDIQPASGCVEFGAERSLGSRHRDHPVVLRLAAVAQVPLGWERTADRLHHASVHPGTHGADNHDRLDGQPPQREGEGFGCGRIPPLEVIHPNHKRLSRRQHSKDTARSAAAGPSSGRLRGESPQVRQEARLVAGHPLASGVPSGIRLASGKGRREPDARR